MALNREKVTLENAKSWIKNNSPSDVPLLDQIKQERELFNFLKDGKVLLRILGYNAQKEGKDPDNSIEDKMIIRTNNVTNLEEENIKLFIEKAKEFYNIDNIFKKHIHKVFKDFNNFYLVLNAIAQLSCKIKDSTPKLKQITQKINTNVSFDDYGIEEAGVHDIYETEANDMYDTYEKYLNVEKEKEEERPTDLTRSIEVFASSHQKYLEALMNLKENFVDKTDSYFLKRHFFSHLQVEELIDLHIELASEIEDLKSDYRRINVMFQMFEEKFLVYGDVLAKCFSIMENIENIMAFNPELRKELIRLQKNSNSNDALTDIIQKIAQHIMRYKNPYLEDIRKQARKASATRVEEEASKAYERMKNMLDHFNEYQKDFSNILTLAELGNLYQYPLKQYGRMYLEIEDVEVSVKANPHDVHKNYHVYIFEEVLVVFGLQMSKKFSYSSNGELDRTFLGEAKFVEFPVHKPVGTFYFKDGYEVRNNGSTKTIEMNTYDDITAKCAKEKSFKIKFKNQDAQNKVYEKIRDLCNEADKETGIKRGSDHQKHNFEIYRNPITEAQNLEDHMRCAECNEYMGGKIFKVIYCLDCKAYFHINCFQIIKDDAENSMYGCFPEPTIKEEDFFVGEKTNDEAKNLLQGKRNGTFLVRYSANHGHYFLSYNECQRENKMIKMMKKDVTIRTVKIKGKILFYITKGLASDSLVDIITENKMDYKLLYPLKSAEADVKDDEADFDTSSRKASTINETEEEDFNSLHYNHGFMDEKGAENLLQNRQKGTFLMRTCRADSKRFLSFVSDAGTVRHYQIMEEDKMYHLEDQDHEFHSVLDLVDHYQSVPKHRRLYLLQGLTKASFHQSLQARQSQPTYLSYYHGIMVDKEAQRKLIREDRGTFLLRQNYKGEYRITYKKSQKIEHIMIFYENSKFHTNILPKQHFATVMKLVEELQAKKLLRTPLPSPFHDRSKRRGSQGRVLRQISTISTSSAQSVNESEE